MTIFRGSHGWPGIERRIRDLHFTAYGRTNGTELPLAQSNAKAETGLPLHQVLGRAGVNMCTEPLFYSCCSDHSKALTEVIFS
jgi:hypothetical protein